MVAYCEDCKRPVNQVCDNCGESFGVTVCEKYACGGTMMCTRCGSKKLTPMGEKKLGPDPYDYSKLSREERMAAKAGEVRGATSVPMPTEDKPKCPICGFEVLSNWKYCPECGVSFGKST